MKILILIDLFVLLISLVELTDNRLDKWLSFKKRFDAYLKPLLNSANEIERFKIFKQNMQSAELENNKNGKKYQLGETVFSHMTYKEFSEKFLIKQNFTKKIQSFKVGSSYLTSDSAYNTPPIIKVGDAYSSNLPTYVNWTLNGKVSPVLYQGACGSCFAFSAAGAVSSAYAIRYDKDPLTFSEQQIVDCTNQYFYDLYGRKLRNFGCKGGDIYNSLLYVQTYGITTVYSYPYVSGITGKNQNCQYQQSKIFTRISDVRWINGANISEMKLAVSKQPITAYLYVDPNFFLYKSGIYSSPFCIISSTDCNNYINHAVLITGYGIENGVEYWIVKNSWSTNWGENGYFRMPLGSNSCCIENGNFNILIY